MKKVNKKSVTQSKEIMQSSTAQYLIFISSTGEDKESVEMRYEDENIWMTQKMMAEMYGVSVPAINQHIKKLIEDKEINDSVIKHYLITANDGKSYKAVHYNLQSIIKNKLLKKWLKCYNIKIKIC